MNYDKLIKMYDLDAGIFKLSDKKQEVEIEELPDEEPEEYYGCSGYDCT